MRDARIGVVLGVALLVLSAWVAPGAATAPEASATPPSGATTAETVETNQVVLTIDVRENGDARWRIEYRTNLDDNNTDAFRSLQEDVQSNPGKYTDRFAGRIRQTVQNAENATGREMNATDFGVSASVDSFNNQGVIAYTFTWQNFANVTREGEQIAVGDAIEGYFLSSKTSMSIQWPEGWTATDVSPAPDRSPGRAVVWEGSATTFGPDQPSVILERDEGTPTTTPGQTTSDTTTDVGATTGRAPTETTPGADSGGGSFPMGLLLVAVVVVVGVGAAWWRRPGGAVAVDDEKDSAAASADSGGVTTTDGDADGDQSAEDAESEEEEPPVDEELLSNEERVLRLLERNGGRIKQQEVVDGLGWTEAKTSQVVSGMREDGDIDSFRLGRENVLTLPDKEIDPTEEDEGDGGRI